MPIIQVISFLTSKFRYLNEHVLLMVDRTFSTCCRFVVISQFHSLSPVWKGTHVEVLSNAALVIEIESGNLENVKLVKDINELKATLLAAMSP